MYNNKTGHYQVINEDKLLESEDTYMQKQTHNGIIEYKSGLELKAIQYCDLSPSIVNYAVEPYAIPYLKPTDGMVHRYFIDLFIEFKSGKKVIVEVKSSGETREPKKPAKVNHRNIRYYKRAMRTWAVNSAKWEAAQMFAEEAGMEFRFLTEKQLDKL